MTRLAIRCFGALTLLTSILATPARAQTCTAAADCPAPLTCKSGGQICSVAGGILPDGGIYAFDADCQAEPSKCTWTFVRCESSSECTQPGLGVPHGA